jgi:phasin
MGQRPLIWMNAMAETSTKPKTAKTAAPSFEMPSFEIPKFDMPKMEVPAAFRDMAEKSISQAKDTYEKMKAAAEEATDLLEDTYATTSKGVSDYGLKIIEVARTNTNAAFDFYSELFAVKSLAEVVELSTAHARKQFETYTAQSKELTAMAQKVATEAVEPVKEGVSKAFKKIG